ncbi:MAG: lactate utilization protein [Synergistaceae bacterium]|nr:lactate utilization protein [Synergistaceae bacterium]
MDDVFKAAKLKAVEAIGKTLVSELSKKGYSACYVNTKEEALSEVLKIIPEKTSVGIPGSVTIREIGAMGALKERGCVVYHHWDPTLTPEQRMEVLQNENLSDYFLTSANAVTTDGMIVNIDGNGNRVSGMAWGRNELIFVIGVNKIAKNLDAAISRARTATPPNVFRLNGDTPCTKTGHCVNCDSAGRVCRVMLILERPAIGRKTHVIVVGEDLGY